MIQNVLRSLGGVGLYGVISVCLFFVVFAGALVWSLAQKKTLMRAMSSLPLENETPDPAATGDKSHE
jgi:hypothetical protein